MESEILEYEGTWEEIAAHEPKFRGFRLRLTVLKEDEAKTPEFAPSARTLLKLPMEERNRILASQAMLLEEEYRTNPDLTDFETFGSDDLYDEHQQNDNEASSR